MELIAYVILLFQLYQSSRGSNILAVFPYGARSHQMVMQAVISTLLDDGHSITCISPVALEGSNPNYTHILTPSTEVNWQDIFEFEEHTKLSPSEGRYQLHILSENFMSTILQSEVFQNFISNEESKYDLIVLEPFFVQESVVFLGHRFKAPMVSIGSCFPYASEDSFSGSGRNPVVTPEFNTFSPGKMNFKTRVLNVLDWLDNMIELKYRYLPEREALLKKYISYPGSDDRPSIPELLSSISLYFTNSNPLVSPVKPSSPNFISIPGLHISQNPVLPKELEILMNNAEEGVILFTLGSMVPVSKMDVQLKDAFVRAFGRMKHLVLWKSDENIEGLPANIRMSKWFPQQAILSHSNCKLLITHGGMLSKQEAIYYGIPMVVIPLFGDQPMNAAHTQEKGFGMALLYHNLTENNIYNTAMTVLSQERYRLNTKWASLIFQDLVKESRKNLKYWINHAIKFKGADYLKTVPINWIHYYMIDVVSFFIVSVILFIFIIYKCSSIISSCYDKNRTHSKKKKD